MEIREKEVNEKQEEKRARSQKMRNIKAHR